MNPMVHISDTACKLCGQSDRIISETLGVCARCLKTEYDTAYPLIQQAHQKSRMQFDLPTSIPKHHNGVQCVLCSNECAIPDRERGYCGLRVVQDGKLTHLAGTPKYGLLHWYRDPLPTNCVAAWVCAGSEQKGHHNLSVFYQSCTANCLFCQNWNFREVSPEQSSKISALGLSQVANERTFCVCYFGGDPASQMPHALATSRVLSGQGVRICWETSGMAHPKLMDPAVRYSFDSGGCVKFDLKAYDDEIHQALTGVSNQRTLDNFARAGKRSLDRPEVPLVIASTLLVPGYVDREQVGKIAAFISSINPDIPYALLAFSPDFYMHDLGFTTTEQAREAERAAKEAGLTNVRVGNQHLLDWYY